MELAANGEEINHSIELFFIRFDNQYIPKSAWTNEELDFLQQFASKYWAKALKEERKHYEDKLLDKLIMLEKLPINLDLLLTAWRDEDSLPALLSFSDLYVHDIDWEKEKVTNSFAEEEFSNTIITFAKDQKTRDLLEQRIEDLFFRKISKLTDEEDMILNNLHTALHNVKLYYN